MDKRLCDLKVGEKAVVAGIEGGGALRKRLMEMGIIGGEEVAVKRFAPLGDPMQVTVGACELAIRKSDAAAVIVRSLRGAK